MLSVRPVEDWMAVDRIWISWERQRRNRTLAAALNVPLNELTHEGGRIARWSSLCWRTWRLLRRTRPAILYVQLPSLLLGLIALLHRATVSPRPLLVVDVHNCCAVSRSGRLVGRRIARAADYALVTNSGMAAQARQWGASPVVMPDLLPELPVASSGAATRSYILVICSWAIDEPIPALIEAATTCQQRFPSLEFWLTGSPRPQRLPPGQQLPANVRLLGFVPEREYEALLGSALIVMDLTTLDDCLVCGGYEAVAAGRPLILSGNSASRAYFTRGACFTSNEPHDIARAVEEALEKLPELERDIAELQSELKAREAAALATLQAELQHACCD